MSTTKVRSNDMKFEIVVIPVSDVDRAKAFYEGLGWRLDAEFASGEGAASPGHARAARRRPPSQHR